MRHLIGMGLLESRSRRSAFNIGTAGGILRQTVETVDQAQHIGHENIRNRKRARQPSTACENLLHVTEPKGQESVQMPPALGLLMVVEELENRGRQCGHLNRVECGEQPLDDFAASLRFGWHQRLALLRDMKQDRAALEDRDVSVGQPWYLPERLVCEVISASITERDTFDAVRQSSLFKRPSDTKVADVAARQFGNPV